MVRGGQMLKHLETFARTGGAGKSSKLKFGIEHSALGVELLTADR